MSWTFQPPPMPPVSTGFSLMLSAAAVMAGLLLLLRGRKKGWLLLVAAGAAVGVVSGGLLAETFNVNVPAARVGGALALALVGLFCASGLWTALLVAVAGLVAAAVMVCQWAVQTGQPLPSFESSAQDLGPYLRDLFDYAYNTIMPVCRGRPHQMLGVCGAAVGIPIVLAVLLQRFMTILATAFFGALAIVGGLMSVALAIWPGLSWPLRQNWYCIAGAVTGLTFVGIVVQYRHALVKKAPPEAQPPPPPKE